MLLSGYTGLKPCRECRTPFRRSRSSAQFCSKKCSHRHTQRNLWRRKHGRVPTVKRCRGCSESFATTKAIKEYCSDTCRRASFQRRSRVITRTIICPVCGSKFVKARANHKYCSKTCNNRAWYMGEIRRSARLTECATCSLPLTDHKRRVYCSKACCRGAQNKKKWARTSYMTKFLAKQAERRSAAIRSEDGGDVEIQELQGVQQEIQGSVTQYADPVLREEVRVEVLG